MKHNYILPLSSSLSSKCYFSLLLKTTFRSSRSETFFKIGRLKHFPIFTGKHLCRNIFITKRLQLRIFPMNNGRFLTTTFFYRTPPVTCFWTFLSFSIIFFLLCLPIAIEEHVFLSVLMFLIQITNIQKKKCNTMKRARDVPLAKLKEFQENFNDELET